MREVKHSSGKKWQRVPYRPAGMSASGQANSIPEKMISFSSIGKQCLLYFGIKNLISFTSGPKELPSPCFPTLFLAGKVKMKGSGH